ncbi:MAG: hypothetical protein IJ249_02670 [Paludibacteraceae bacterium]|nr:hypothetical protein [Paludibacteraceae bacterium]
MKNVVYYILSAQKKIFALAFLAVFSSFYTMVWADTDYSRNGITAVYSGTVLTISAGSTGVMPDYIHTSADYKIKAPWSTVMTKITEVVINEGITYIGNDAFYGASSITKVTLRHLLIALERMHSTDVQKWLIYTTKEHLLSG